MGGDGGTLNNSRHEHTRLRQSVMGLCTKNEVLRQVQAERGSVTDCAASKQRLQPPHVVVDRLGLLYNKEPLIGMLLQRARKKGKDKEKGKETDVFAYIKSVKRDTRPVKLIREREDGGEFICEVTKKVVVVGQGFSVGWDCGCVTAKIDEAAANGIGKAKRDVNVTGSTKECISECMGCGQVGRRIVLGMTGLEREDIRNKLLDQQQTRKKRKRKAEGGDDGKYEEEGGKMRRICEASVRSGIK